MEKDLAREKWRSHVKHCKERGVKPLELHIYKSKLIDANITPNKIGRTLGSYQLARYSDSGDYTESNCRFITQTENLKERCLNGGTERGIALRRGLPNIKTSLSLTGRTAKTHDYIARIADSKAKEYSVISPDGEFLIIRNLRKFCRESGLDRSCFRRMLLGQTKSYKNWSKANQREVQT